MNQLRKIDRKVILVFFGDHQPFFPDDYNEAWFANEDAAIQNERLWQTDYIIWANYDVAGRDQESGVDDLSINYLGSVLMNLIGAPMSDYQKAHITLREALPAINATGYEDKSLRWYLSSMAAEENFPGATRAPRRPRRARITPRCSTTSCSETERTSIPRCTSPPRTRPIPTWRPVPRRSSNPAIRRPDMRSSSPPAVRCSVYPRHLAGGFFYGRKRRRHARVRPLDLIEQRSSTRKFADAPITTTSAPRCCTLRPGHRLPAQ